MLQTHLLYLALDNSLQDCSDLPSGDISDTEIVQDYKKLSKKCSNPGIQKVNICVILAGSLYFPF